MDTLRNTSAARATEVETARLAAVARYGILDTPPDGAFDRVAALAARLLDVPIATVSIVDTDRIWFKATSGLAGVTQIGRDPGLCASAILRDEPHVVPDALADPVAAENPLVRGELGVRFYAGAPLITPDGYRLGTVNVLDTRPRELDEDQVTILTDLAAMVVDHLELRLSALRTVRQERSIRDRAEEDKSDLAELASTLQRSLLPPSLPDVPDMDVACHYRAASPDRVLGDFYDLFPLGDGRWAFFLGDVEGHGPPAAATTSLVRYTLRSAALHHQDPAHGLDEVNKALLLDKHSRQFCTVLYGTINPCQRDGVEITLASGGHPPAMLLQRGATQNGVMEVSPGGMLVGALPDAKFETCKLELRPGQTLLLYTDGLIEARPGGTFFGETGLKAFLAEQSGTDATTVIAALTDLITGFDPPPDDDIALLALGILSLP